MSVSLHVVFLRDKDGEHHQNMLGVARACAKARMALPPAAAEYFGVDEGDANYAINPDDHLEMNAPEIIREYRSGYACGYEVDVTNLPEGVTRIRVYNS